VAGGCPDLIQPQAEPGGECGIDGTALPVYGGGEGTPPGEMGAVDLRMVLGRVDQVVAANRQPGQLRAMLPRNIEPLVVRSQDAERIAAEGIGFVRA